MGIPDTRRVALRAVAASPALRRVVGAFWLFIVSEYAAWAALLFFAYTRGGAAESGAVAIVQLLPAAVLAPIFAAAADRYPPGWVLVGGLLVQTAGLAMAATAMAVGAAPAWWLTGAVVDAVAVTSTRPAQIAVLPCVSRNAAELSAAAVALGWAENLGVAASGALVGVLLSISSPAGIVAVCAGCSAAAALLVCGVPSLPVAVSADQARSGAVGSLLDGVRALGRAPRERLVVALATGMWIVVGALDVLVPVLAVGVLHSGADWVGYLNAAIGVGGILGAGLTVRLLGRRLGAPILLSAGLVSVALAATAASRAVALTGLFLAVVGMGRAVLTVSTSMLLQRRVDPQRLARIFGLLEGLTMAGLAAGAALVPALMHAGGSELAVLGTAAVLPLIAVFGGRRTWRLDDGTTRPAVEIRVLRKVSLFDALPSQELERLAGSAEHVAAPAGTAVVRQGEPGADLYVLARGEADVVIDGHRVRHLRAGTAFGEVAALRSVPRSATVVTTTSAEMYRIDARTLLPVLSSHAESWQALDAVVRRYLTPERAGR